MDKHVRPDLKAIEARHAFRTGGSAWILQDFKHLIAYILWLEEQLEGCTVTTNG